MKAMIFVTALSLSLATGFGGSLAEAQNMCTYADKKYSKGSIIKILFM